MQLHGNVLANRLTSFILAGVVAFYVLIGISLALIRNQSNAATATYTSRFVLERLDVLRDQVRQFTRDYNNWADVYIAAKEGRIGFIADNYGITAVNGDMFDGAIIFDGPFIEPIAWRSGGDRKPEKSFLTLAELEEIRLQVLELPAGDRPTFDFVVLEQGAIRFASASRILPDVALRQDAIDIDSAPIGVIFRTPSQSEYDNIESSLRLREFSIGPRPEVDADSLPLPGVDGEAFLYASWLPPLPGDRLLQEVTPVLAFILGIFTVVVIVGTQLLRRSTQALAAREEDALQVARRDALTGLPNRLALSEYLNSLSSDSGGGLAVVLLDLDGFKNINDLVGHGGGDHVICEIGERLRSMCRPGIFIARVGGDEFVLVVHGPGDVEWSAQSVAGALLELISEPIVYQGSRFEVTCSCGVATRKSSEQTVEELMQCADRAMYSAKRLAGNVIVVYDKAMDEESSSDRQIEISLRSSLLKPEEFSISYQPIVDARSRRLDRIEALARWSSSSHGSVGPDTFIPIAEKGGVMVALGEILLSRVASDMKLNTSLRVSVNVSPLQLMTPGFAVRAREVFLRQGIDPCRVEMELTEGLAVQNLDAVSGQLDELRSFGFTTALDDFGTGYSSIGYLANMPFDTLKIDRSFVSGPISQVRISDFVLPIISLGHLLGKRVTAEGVETELVADMLADLGCDCLQGYYFGRPQSIDSIVHHFISSKAEMEELLV